MSETRRKYDEQFKLEAVQLTLQEGVSVKQISRDLGIQRNPQKMA